jgi:hypothetical protein
MACVPDFGSMEGLGIRIFLYMELAYIWLKILVFIEPINLFFTYL